MAESAVSFVINKLPPFLEEERKLLGEVRKEVEYVKKELESMKAFLRVADEIEESDPEIQVWVKQVREAAYDTEDVLDEFVLRFPHHRGQGFFASLRKISFYVKNLKARHWIASEIKDIKSQIKDISEIHERYGLKLNVREIGSSSIAGTKTNDRRENAFLLEEAKLVGINKHKEKLMQWLIEGHPELKVVSIVGMGGLGKTTLAGKVYEDEKVQNHFEIHARITVSQSFQLEELLKDMIQQLYDEIKKPVPKTVKTMSGESLLKFIKDLLRERRYVLVLDDVWSISAWLAFEVALPDSNCGSRVILTTRIEEVAVRSCNECHGNVYKLTPLSENDSCALFCRKTFGRDCCPPPLKELSKTILKRCFGLPLAIVVISGVLATKNQNRIDEWEIVCHNLGVQLKGDDGFKSMKRILLLSYNDLSFHLKSCFLYLSIFPEDHLIERMRLIRLWIAEGFVEEEEGKIPEEVADDYINQLINRSLIQVAETTLDGRVKLCRIHDVLREIILSKSTDQNLLTISSDQKRSTWPAKVRRLSIHNSMENVQENKNVSRLRSLLFFGMVESIPISSLLSLRGGGGPRLLKVVDLRGAPVSTFPNEITKLFHLTYLSLRDTKVKMLPSSIGKLQNLQTLDLKNTNVTVLPVAISQLTQLCHLLVYSHKKEVYLSFHNTCGFKGPARIGGLVSLQKLCHIEANKGGGILVKEMGMLVQLRRLGIIKLRREDGVALCSSIEKMRNLRSLDVTSAEEEDIIDLQNLSSPPQWLQKVYLSGCLEKLPHWINPSLHDLVKLRLSYSRLKDDPLEPLGALPNLVELRLRKAYDGETLCFKGSGFQRLKFLTLHRLDGLKVVSVEKGSMPNLGDLVIECCKLLERVPSGIEYLANLNELDLYDMCDKFVKAVKQDGRDGDKWKIEHISRVWIGSSNDGTWKGYYLKGPSGSGESNRPEWDRIPVPVPCWFGMGSAYGMESGIIYEA